MGLHTKQYSAVVEYINLIYVLGSLDQLTVRTLHIFMLDAKTRFNFNNQLRKKLKNIKAIKL